MGLNYFLILIGFFRFCNCSENNNEETKLKLIDSSSTTPGDYNDINSKERKTEILNEILGGNYDSTVRAPGLESGGGPTIVYISVIMRSVDNIDDVKMDYSVQITFRQEWTDPRIKYSHIDNNIKYLHLKDATRIWTPDLFFLNEKKGVLHELMVPNLFTRIYPNGTILQSYRITLLLSCIFDLRQFPLDVQSCPLSVSSYGWTTEDLAMEWRNFNPVEIAKDFNMARFKVIDKIHTGICNDVTSTGTYPCVRLNLSFEREIGFYVIQIYIPCGMLVIVSWVSFWLEPTATEARVSLGVTTILTIVTQTYGINQSAPPASYVKALDVWTAFCQAMVFGALLQFALVNYISHSQFLKAKKVYGESTERTGLNNREALEVKLKENSHKQAKRIDFASRVIFPCIFILFNIIYWAIYCK